MIKKQVILCVDDEKLILDSLKKQLKRYFEELFLIEIAESAEEALALFDELRQEGHDIPLVITDFTMPGMRGDELLRRIHQYSPNTLNILLTGQATVEGVRNIINQAGLFMYLVKPWSAEELVSTVNQGLKIYQQGIRIEQQNKELAELNASLERKVQQRTEELEHKNRALQELNHEKDLLMSIVAHDLKAPLNKVKGVLELIKLAGHLNEDQQQYMRLAGQTIERGYHLIRDLLDINAYEHQGSEPDCQDVALVSLLEEQLVFFEAEATQKNITLQRDFPPQTTVVCTDGDFVVRILNNLLSNALKFSYPHTTVMISLKLKANRFELTIKDQGQGFSDEDKRLLFKKFQRLSARPTQGEGSTGLGLAIIKTLVDKLGGTIDLQSQQGQGTTFVVSLPNGLRRV
ncbi:hybrid sensor histidine kinase/response regulator [Eisenibacter elegans]|uniref:hybrid sensor histidine kinase/response regulator n=1 Tax=Eisenibacter elegans TaxID=997 RepID=UPI001377D773|nr:hybrid sensor histidine kinase/response regulator [Eisenibacter elegans]